MPKVISYKKINHYRRKGLNLLYIYTTSLIDAIAYTLRLPIKKISPNFYTQGVLIYVSDINWPRISRMCKWLKRNENMNIVLLCSTQGYNTKFNSTTFDGISFYRNAWHLRRILRTIKGARLIQGFGPLSKNLASALKETKGIYIHDMQDVLVTYEGINPKDRGIKKDIPFEKYCLEHSTAIIGECLEIQNAYRIYQIQNKPANIFFPLCCDNDMFQVHTKELNLSEIHIAYAGQVHGSWRDKNKYGVTQFSGLIKSLAKQHIHFHVYPSPTNVKADYEEYESMGESNPYFHYHKSVSNENLTSELSQYDFGLLPFFKAQGGSSDTKWKYATTMKLFNYWEASLPIIVSGDLFYQSWLIQRYAAGIVLNKVEDLDNLNSIIPDYSYSKLLKNVDTARQYSSFKKNTSRLIKFYDSL